MSKTATLELGALGKLVSPVGGVVSGLERLAPELVRSKDTVTLARLGEVALLRDPEAPKRFGVELDGIGCHLDPDVSARIALMEALERYAAAAGSDRHWVTSPAIEMGPDAIDLSDIARCSETETEASDFPLTQWDPAQPLRWTRGWSLVTGRDVWVPAVMSHLGITPNHPVEHFWLQSSSGCAAATSEEAALLGACFELIERDAVAIAWLRRLPLRRAHPLELESLRCRQGAADDPDWGWDTVLRTLESDKDGTDIAVFDATSDLGVPTALAVLLPPAGSGLPPAVGAGCSDVSSRAALKAVREVTVVRACLWSDSRSDPPAQVPEEAFHHLFPGPASRGQSSRPASAGPGLVDPRGGLSTSINRRLERVVSILAEESSDVVAVDLTPVELEGTGVRVVRVIVPPLIPYLADTRVRYLASRRLFEAPRRMGLTSLPTQEVNPWPSPLW
ncbi:MAG TPA: YcaO-like family protein [Solirubrobacteraceae bacterium]|nr:YcaO-like family protein [Solirubrobacteraceae bacterium]